SVAFQHASLVSGSGTASIRPSLLSTFNAPATTEIYTLSLHDALPISSGRCLRGPARRGRLRSSRLRGRYADVRSGHSVPPKSVRSEEHTSELQSRENLVCRLLLEKKKPTPATFVACTCYAAAAAAQRG